jgi:hypothetical protein
LSEYIIEKYKETLKIEESEVLQYYIENTEAFKTEEVRTFYFLTFKEKSSADAAMQDIQSGGFMTYYEAQSSLQTCDYFGILSHYEKSYFPTSIATQLFAMEVETVYPEPLSTFQNSGYTILYLSESIKNYTFTYDEMKESIEEVIIELEVDEYLKTFFEELNNKYKVQIIYGN